MFATIISSLSAWILTPAIPIKSARLLRKGGLRFALIWKRSRFEKWFKSETSSENKGKRLRRRSFLRDPAKGSTVFGIVSDSFQGGKSYQSSEMIPLFCGMSSSSSGRVFNERAIRLRVVHWRSGCPDESFCQNRLGCFRSRPGNCTGKICCCCVACLSGPSLHHSAKHNAQMGRHHLPSVLTDKCTGEKVARQKLKCFCG